VLFRMESNFRLRAYAMGTIFFVLMTLILIRYAWISFFPTNLRLRLVNTGTKQFESSITIEQSRATIVDRYGRILSMSVPSTSIFLLPKRMPKNEEIMKKVADQIGISFEDMASFAKEKKNFVWLERHLSSDQMQKIGSLHRWQDFIGTLEEPKRVYPEKDIAAQLIGIVGSDGNGLEGVEKIYNSMLNTKPIKAQVMKDARGQLVITSPSQAGRPEPTTPNLKLSLDLIIQEFTQNALRAGVLHAKAESGSAIVMDVQTNEILAMASYPSYDLNTPPENDVEARRFHPIMDAIEVGSVVKPMWIAKALDLGVITPQTQVFAENGEMSLPGGKIHDTHKHGLLTPEEVLKFSSNIGAYKVVQKMGRDEFYKAFLAIGFDKVPGTGLPGEWGGHVQASDDWREMRFANMAFGQGFAISPLQLIHGFSTVVGGGMMRNLSLLKADPNAQEQTGSHRYVAAETSKTLAHMLESVVEEDGGTGAPARIPGVLVAGKTGTAQVWSSVTHSYSERTPVFEGTFPADNPKIAIVVVLNKAGVRPAYGGPLAGPVFAEIGKKIVDYLNVRGIYSIPAYENSYLQKKNKILHSESNTPRDKEDDSSNEDF